jgi:hypothetical protein
MLLVWHGNGTANLEDSLRSESAAIEKKKRNQSQHYNHPHQGMRMNKPQAVVFEKFPQDGQQVEAGRK